MKKIAFLCITLFVLVLAACSSDTNKNEGSKKEGSTGDDTVEKFVFASSADVAGLSPIMTNDSISSVIYEHVYETLFIRNQETGEIEGKLAESFENPDELTWLITLKKDIMFHDGTLFNAEAVKYTFDKLRDPAVAAPRASLLEPVEQINVIDDYQVEIKTKYPYGPFLASLAHSNASIISPTADQKQDLNKQPVGTGAFEFVSYTPGEQITLEANTEHRDGTPKIKQFIFKVIPEVSTAISMLETGQVDLIDNISAQHLPRIESLNNVDTTIIDGTSVYYLSFNHQLERSKDAEFRQAVAAAVDRDAFVDKLNGLGFRNNSVLGPAVFGYDKSRESYGQNYDEKLAQKLVKKNKYSDKPIKILTANRDNYVLMAEIVQSQLTEAGFKAEIETLEWATFLDTARAGDYDITFLSWSNLTQDGSEMFYPNLHSDNLGSSNRAQYSNTKFDELVDASRTTLDQEKRKQYLDEANKLLLDDNAVVVMYHGKMTAAMNSKYDGLIVEPNSLWNASKVHGK